MQAPRRLFSELRQLSARRPVPPPRLLLSQAYRHTPAASLSLHLHLHPHLRLLHASPAACSRHIRPTSASSSGSESKSKSKTEEGPRERRRRAPVAVRTLLASGGLLSLFIGLSEPFNVPQQGDVDASGSVPSTDGTDETDDRDPSLPRFRLTEIRKHDAKSSTPWVTHADKVYDITEWIEAHPGGDVILRAAGASIEPYWDIFTIHKSPHVRDILNQYLIGFIDNADLVDGKPAAQEIEDPFKHDPNRDPRLITLTPKPRNAETPVEALSDSYLTPNELFYVRNHMWVPQVDDTSDYTLKIELLDGSVKEYTLHDLKTKFKPSTIVAVLQCSGNRRSDMTRNARKTNGLQWNVGAISCAEWQGVKLSDVLADAGLPVHEAMTGDTEAKHIQFSALEAYGASIPIESALDPRGDVLLAYSMNGEPLPRDHGFPLRALVPGHVAARSVKWLNQITISDEESHSQWQRKDYKCFGPNETSPDWDRAAAIQEMPITSAITTVRLGDWAVPAEASLADGVSRARRQASLQGYAYSGGGRKIVRVDVSVDNGKTWDQAELLEEPGVPQKAGRKTWAWKRWRYDGLVPLTELGEGEKKCTTLLVKATDEAYNSQPESYAAIFNQRGNLANAWHRLKICSECAQQPSQPPGLGNGKQRTVENKP
ncbi:Sulfite oxidase [Colletotrichum sidae]|uniref:Nitrate reductase [NADPH] n=1 Tax=Colletotrichum sidae TaxID=1347389 RepID=A0A4R8TER7_9PEZI|nr:Sulfite oxidase [Colletotrichum sidae]